MIPEFPKFSKLTIKLKDHVRLFTSNFEPYSDFNFTSLLCWNTDGSTEVSKLNHNLIIKLSDYLTGETFYSLLGDKMIDKTLQELLGNGLPLMLVPAIVVKNIKLPDIFSVAEDRDSFDYIYNLADLSILTGNDYKKKRNKLNKLNKDIGLNLRPKVIDSFSKSGRDEFRNIVTEWSENRNRSDNNNDREKQAIERTMEFSDELGLFVLGFYYSGNLVGFSVNEKLSDGYAICHFEKALLVHENIYTYMTNQAAQELLSIRCKYVNWEQDLGIPGLRKAKMIYKPERFLQKYQVKLISGT